MQFIGAIISKCEGSKLGFISVHLGDTRRRGTSFSTEHPKKWCVTEFISNRPYSLDCIPSLYVLNDSGFIGVSTKLKPNAMHIIKVNGRANGSVNGAVSMRRVVKPMAEYLVEHSISDWVNVCLPDGYSQNHTSLWNIARARLSYFKKSMA